MTNEIFNIQNACDELKIGKEIYLRIIGRAIEQTQKDIEALRVAQLNSDIDQIQEIAHRFKGDYANLRIDQLSTIANQLSILVKENYDGVRALVLIEEFAQAFDQVKQFIQGQD